MTLIENTEITAEEIALQGLQALDEKYQKTVGFFAWDFFVAIGKIIYDVWQKIIYIAHCLTDLSYMDYEDLKNFIFQTRGLEPKPATASSGYLTVTNGSGSISTTDVFATESGIEFNPTENGDVNEGERFKVECKEVGLVGNVFANTITKIPTTIRGIVSVTNEKAFTNGYNEESKEDLLDRYYEDIQKPTISGNIYHYKKWALECTGVGDCKIKPLWNGANTVKIVIIGSNKEEPSQDLINTVQEYIDPKSNWGCGAGQAPIGAYCTVAGAIAYPINISFNVIHENTISLEDAKTEITNKINEYLKSTIFESNYVSYQKLGATILSVKGVIDYQNLKINDSDQNITLTDNDEITQIATLGNITIEEVLEDE